MIEVKNILLPNGADKVELLNSFFNLGQEAWEQAIKPKMKAIRSGNVDKDHLKGGGTDFFTEADAASENIIKQGLVSRFGKDAFRIYGEEQGGYTNNLNSEITIRIDPIDGTEGFKFGKPSWSIMIGAYIGRNKQERQILSTVFYPEYYNQIIYRVDTGVFIKNVATDEITEVANVKEQNELDNIIVACYKHTDIRKRGRIDDIIKGLENLGARVRSLSSAELLEAIATGGKRAMIIDGDFDQSDFIPYSILAQLGYRIYGWDGKELNVDDPDLSDKKLVVIPPGGAGKNILEIVKRYAN